MFLLAQVSQYGGLKFKLKVSLSYSLKVEAYIPQLPHPKLPACSQKNNCVPPSNTLRTVSGMQSSRHPSSDPSMKGTTLVFDVSTKAAVGQEQS